jgi:ATP-dependent Clp protease ATP-binding subunit ClpC
MQLFRRKNTTSGKTAPKSIYDFAREVKDRFDEVAHPAELTADDKWNDAVNTIAGSPATETELRNYALGENHAVASLALSALGARGDGALVAPILTRINDYRGDWAKFFALRALERLVPPPHPLLGRLFVALDDDWSERYEHFLGQFIRELVERRLGAGEPPSFDGALDDAAPARLRDVRKLLGVLDRALTAPLRDELEAHQRGRVDVEYLKSIGTVWKDDPPAAIEHDALDAGATLIEHTLTAERRRSVLLVGDDGAGKTTMIRAAACRLRARGWTVFEASGPELAAGMVYIGEMEERVQRILREAGGGRRVVWIIPALHELLHAGAHRHNPRGILDWLLPEIAAGSLAVLAEESAGAYQKLMQQMPAVQSAFVSYRVDPLGEAATLDLAHRWTANGQHPTASDAVIREAWHLTQQYLGMQAAPGNLLRVMQSTLDAIRATGETRAMTIDDVVAALARLTGLTSSILDEREPLDLAALRSRLGARVLGQQEAVDVLVDRVAMIKAGVTDPTRPFGVFLFAGPTGSGKTEAAKTLAELLFGSTERLIRLDMSEFKESASLARILGDESGEASSLVDAIRKQPFAVVLLDEIEKAHPNVWDLFLQVFDDGRLTDRRGVAADFRHAIVIMTSNAGTAIRSSVGFGDDGGLKPAPPLALEREFRREFLNRIDRVVVFRPLDRSTMRRILRKEIAAAFSRRGLRNRKWTVDLDATALAFLLEVGFTKDLGARPLKRAVERHLLTPLAEMIVTNRAPRSDQRVLLRADGNRLAIDFIERKHSAPRMQAKRRRWRA